jgi:hypothetical protein
LVQSDFLGFIFSFRLTFSDSTTRKPWYQSQMVDESRRWTFSEMAGLAFPSSTIFIFLWLSSLHLSDPTACFNSSVYSLLDCQPFLILLGGALTLNSLQLVQWENAELMEVSGWLIAMWAVLVLTILWATGIAGIDPGFGVSAHSLYSCPFLDLLLVIAFGFGSTAFCLLVLGVLFHLDLALLTSSRLTSLPTLRSVFTDCQSFLMLTLLSRALPLNSLQLVQWEKADYFTAVSGWFAMWSILIITTL